MIVTTKGRIPRKKKKAFKKKFSNISMAGHIMLEGGNIIVSINSEGGEV